MGVARLPGIVVAAVAVLAALAPGAGAAGRCGAHPWCDTHLSPDRRADLLLAALTDAEKVSLLGGDDIGGVAGGAHAHTGTQNGVPRLEVPTVLYTDGPQGPRQGKTTGLPAPLALAATWDPRMAARYGDVVAQEASSKGNDVVYGPVVNIMRTPLGGRTFEGYGEDPLLVARTAVAWIRALQARGVIADVKHFAGNNQEGYSPDANRSRPGQPVGPAPTEGSRLLVNARIDDRTLREVYLPAFEAAVRDGGAGTVMCAYNKVNGAYSCQNEPLLTSVLRGWGFRGYVLSDYGAAHDLVPSLRSGLDFEPWPGTTLAPGPVGAALASGQLSMTDVSRSVGRMLRTFFAFGVFDRQAFRDDDSQIPQRAHARSSREVEESAITLLVNRRATLPLRADRLRSIALLGPGIDRFVTGGGSGNVTPFAVTTLQDAVSRRTGGRVTITRDDGADPARAADLARRAEVAVVAAPDYLTEGSDRACLSLECPPAFGDLDRLIRAVAAANRRTIVVLETGGPVLTPWRGKVAGLLEAWYPGQEGGAAIARVLFGDADPAGRLPATFPESVTQLPTAGDREKYPGVNNQETYKEGVLVGYRWYDAMRLRPAFPFGFGLSYTRFRLSGLRVSAASASVLVRNVGRRAGSTVAQLYVGIPSRRAVVQPPRQLRGYGKVSLRPGRAARVSFPLTPRSFAYWDAATKRWRVAPGCYRVWAGESSRDLPLRATLPLAGGACR
jgi:beta-glucosidase